MKTAAICPSRPLPTQSSQVQINPPAAAVKVQTTRNNSWRVSCCVNRGLHKNLVFRPSGYHGFTALGRISTRTRRFMLLHMG